jgi:hypothetical protein
MSGLWGSGLARTFSVLRQRVGDSLAGRSAGEEAGRGEAPDSPLSPDHPMGQDGEAVSCAEDGARKRQRAPRRALADSSWQDDDELDYVDDDEDGADVSQMATSAAAAARRRAASTVVPRRGASSMPSARRMGEFAEEVKIFGPETSHDAARAAAKKMDACSWKLVSSKSGQVVTQCVTHHLCGRKLKLVYYGTEEEPGGALLLGNGVPHSTVFSAFPYVGKGIGGEFVDEVKAGRHFGWGPATIWAQAEHKYVVEAATKDELKWSRFPTQEKISSHVKNMQDRGSLMTNVDMMELVGPMEVTSLEQALLRPPNAPVVLDVMFRAVDIPVYDDTGDETGETRPETTMALVISSPTLMLFVRDLVVSLAEKERFYRMLTGADGTYKLAQGNTASGAVLIDVVIHDVTYNASIDKDVHNSLPILYCYCQIECFEVYYFLFMTLKDMPNKFLGLAGRQFVPEFGSLDRASYIAKAFRAVWPDADADAVE